MKKIPTWMIIALIVLAIWMFMKYQDSSTQAISYTGLQKPGGLGWSGASGSCEWRNGQCASSKSSPCISGSCKVSSANVCGCQ